MPTLAETVKPEAIGQLLTATLGRSVSVVRSRQTPGKGDLFGVYANSEKMQKAGLLVSLSLAAHLAAALQIFPPARANQNITSGRLEEEFVENVQEILNICSQVVTNATGERMTLAEVCPWDKAPQRFKDALRSAAAFEVTIQGYGKGLLSVVA